MQVGIDFGTTNSSVAFVLEKTTSGCVELAIRATQLFLPLQFLCK